MFFLNRRPSLFNYLYVVRKLYYGKHFRLSNSLPLIMFICFFKVWRLLYTVEFVQSVLTRALYNLSLVFIKFRIALVIHLDFGSKMFSLAYNNNFFKCVVIMWVWV